MNFPPSYDEVEEKLEAIQAEINSPQFRLMLAKKNALLEYREALDRLQRLLGPHVCPVCGGSTRNPNTIYESPVGLQACRAPFHDS